MAKTLFTVSTASPAFVARNELDFACLYSMRNTELALQCAHLALSKAIEAGRSDLAYAATYLIHALNGGR